ncbi:MAG: carboxypeptidase-like regulatory domain-containing protein [Candidatus Bathyarchaeia archaeon]|nr:carboxypeptidase-like regulatory domain-containing protein [Candidatus Bathyarchaeia archaeon]
MLRRQRRFKSENRNSQSLQSRCHNRRHDFGNSYRWEEPVAGAIIEVAIPRFSIAASTTTSVNGSYIITNLPEGCYKVSVYAQGKINQTKTGVIVTAGQTTELDFTLRENAITTANNMINVEGQPFHVVTVSNSTITNFTFNITLKKVSFAVSATADTTGFCNITIPEILLQPPYTVKVDGNIIQFLTSSNGTHSIINFSYTHSTHTVEIIGENVIPEFPTDLLLLLSTCLCSLATLFIKKETSEDSSCSALI